MRLGWSSQRSEEKSRDENLAGAQHPPQRAAAKKEEVVQFEMPPLEEEKVEKVEDLQDEQQENIMAPPSLVDLPSLVPVEPRSSRSTSSRVRSGGTLSSETSWPPRMNLSVFDSMKASMVDLWRVGKSRHNEGRTQ